MTKYTHLDLNKDVKSISGYYIPQKEVRLQYNNREVLYITGQVTIDSSCCGSAEYFYALVPGYITAWQSETNSNGLPVSDVEPIHEKATQDEIKRIIEQEEHLARIDFW